MSKLSKADYRKLLEAISNKLPSAEEREKLLVSNGMICFSSYVSAKTGYMMKARRFLQKRRNEAILTCMCEVRDLCKEARIPYVFLKGLCLAVQIYDPPETRVFDDVDVLVSEKDCKQLIQECQKAGFSFEEGIKGDDDSPYVRIQNGHMHAEVLRKAYETDNGSIMIPLEIHVSPNERCYEMYGQILEDNGYTEELISRARVVTVQMPDGKKEAFMVPAIEDDFYTQALHMIMHMGLDQVLYLYVDKPWQSQSILKQAMDLYLFAEIEKPEWRVIERLATEQKHLEEYRCAIDILDRLWGMGIPEEAKAEADDYNRPIDFVCRILNEIDIRQLLGNDGGLKKAIDDKICQWIREQKDAIPEGMQVSCREEGIALSVDTGNIRSGRYDITLYSVTEENTWKIEDYILEIAESEWILYQSNGFRMIWDPDSYGKVSIQQADRLLYKRIAYDESNHSGSSNIPINYMREIRSDLLIDIKKYTHNRNTIDFRFIS